MRPKLWIATLAALSSIPAAARAQDALFLPERHEVRLRDHERVEFSIGVIGRLSAMDGELDPDVPVDYSDLFGTGLGFAVEGAILFDAGVGWQVGPYLSIGLDTFEGEKDTDALGDTLEADDLEFLTVLVGGKGVFPFAPFWHVEMHAALGVVHNNAVDGVLTVSGVPSDVEVFSDSATIAFDFGGRIGFRVEQFFGELGFGIRVQGAPADGDLDFSSDAPAQIALEAGFGLRF